MTRGIIKSIKIFAKWGLFVTTAMIMIIGFLEEAPCSAGAPQTNIDQDMEVKFCNVNNDKLKRCFLTVLKGYEQLHGYQIHLHQKQLGGSTMKAQPIIKLVNLFTGFKSYKITVGYTILDSDTSVEDIPDKVLKGWFAHELGHISDYEQYSNIRMIWYGLKYLTSSAFKKKVEHEADYIAIKNGFKQEIIATKKFILFEGLFSDRYLNRINKYYLPLESIEQSPEDTLSGIYHE